MMGIPSWVKFAALHSKDAFSELGFLAVFALMPVWLTTMLKMLEGKSIFVQLGSYLYSGEALLISAVTIGPLFYLITREYDKRDDGFSRSFPWRNLLSITTFAICLISACIIGRQAVPFSFAIISKDILWYMSLVVTLCSIAIWLSVTLIRNSLESGAAGVMRLDTEDFVKQFGKTHG
ncbi:hypothetical protein NKH19_19595 [Mesorhizobium sp. M1338]|uniref:hypothetical protein n=1 Tax=unclassified Mesorhizobium TaxID=325217 RepID=UPI003335877D